MVSGPNIMFSGYIVWLVVWYLFHFSLDRVLLWNESQRTDLHIAVLHYFLLSMVIEFGFLDLDLF